MTKSCKNTKSLGFTLIELLVVISVIGFLATASMVAFNSARKKARDAQRLADMKQIQTALELYFDNNGQYPTSDGDGCDSWDVGNKDFQLLNNKLPGIMNKAPNDPTATGNCNGYKYYRYTEALTIAMLIKALIMSWA
jgi:prepilin-type N-terminal cleavage/methylation domain-containing protein